MKHAPIYLDYNASSPIREEVLQVLIDVSRRCYGNASSAHYFGWQASAIVDEAAGIIAAACQAPKEGVIFTASATEANNLFVSGIIEGYSSRCSSLPVLISSDLEHSSVRAQLSHLHSSGLATIVSLPHSIHGELSVPSLQCDMNRAIAASIHFAHNEIGVLQDLDSISSALKALEPDIQIHSDTTQALGKTTLPVHAVDALTIAGHKIGGPKGVGALVLRYPGLLDQLEPQIRGGGHQRGLRSGTLDTAHIAALGETVRLAIAEQETTEKTLRHLTSLLFTTLLEGFPTLQLIGPPLEKRLPGNISVRFPGVRMNNVLSSLSTQVAISSGAACQSDNGMPSPTLTAIGFTPAEAAEVVRLSVGTPTTPDEIMRASQIILATVNNSKTNI